MDPFLPAAEVGRDFDPKAAAAVNPPRQLPREENVDERNSNETLGGSETGFVSLLDVDFPARSAVLSLC